MKRTSGVNTVRASLEAYATRGVFRGLSETPKTNGASDFVFTWLTERPMNFRFDSQRKTMRFRDLLPNVAGNSQLNDDLKVFLRERKTGELPTHRRIDARRADVAFTRRNGSVSLALKVKQSDYDYGVNKIVNLVHDLFVHLQQSHFEYLTENFNVSQE